MALRVSERERKLILAFIALLAVYVAYFRVYAPTSARLYSLENEVDIAIRQLQTARQAAMSLTALEQELENLQSRLQAIWKEIGVESELPVLVRTLEDYARESGVTVLSVRPGKALTGSYVAEMPLELTLEGTFEGLVAFLRLAEEGQPAIAFTKITVDAISSESKLNAAVSGKIYYRLEQ